MQLFHRYLSMRYNENFYVGSTSPLKLDPITVQASACGPSATFNDERGPDEIGMRSTNLDAAAKKRDRNFTWRRVDDASLDLKSRLSFGGGVATVGAMATRVAFSDNIHVAA